MKQSFKRITNPFIYTYGEGFFPRKMQLQKKKPARCENVPIDKQNYGYTIPEIFTG